MRRFRFNLEPIRQQRKWTEEQRLLEYAEAQRQEHAQREHLNEIQKHYDHYAQQLEQAKTERFDVVLVQDYLNYLNLVAQRRSQQRAAVDEAAAAAAQAGERWAGARRNLKAIDSLREHAYERHVAQGRSEEQRFLDDIGRRPNGTLQR